MPLCSCWPLPYLSKSFPSSTGEVSGAITKQSLAFWMSYHPHGYVGITDGKLDMNESQSVATNSHLPTAAYSPGSWWPPHRFYSLPLHILYFSSYSGLIEGSQIRTDLKQPPSTLIYNTGSPLPPPEGCTFSSITFVGFVAPSSLHSKLYHTWFHLSSIIFYTLIINKFS